MLNETDYQSPRAVEGDLERRNDGRLGNRVDVDEFQKILGRTEAQRQILRQVRNFGRSPFNPDNERLWPEWLKGRGPIVNSLSQTKRRPTVNETQAQLERRLSEITNRARRAHTNARKLVEREKLARKLYQTAIKGYEAARLADPTEPHLDTKLIARTAWRFARQLGLRQRLLALGPLSFVDENGASMGRSTLDTDLPDNESDAPTEGPKTDVSSEAIINSTDDVTEELTGTLDYDVEPEVIDPIDSATVIRGKPKTNKGRQSPYGLTSVKDVRKLRDLEELPEVAAFFAKHPELHNKHNGDGWNAKPCSLMKLRALGVVTFPKLSIVPVQSEKKTRKPRVTSSELIAYRRETHPAWLRGPRLPTVHNAHVIRFEQEHPQHNAHVYEWSAQINVAHELGRRREQIIWNADAHRTLEIAHVFEYRRQLATGDRFRNVKPRAPWQRIGGFIQHFGWRYQT